MGATIEFIDYLLEPLHLCLVEHSAGLYTIEHIVTKTLIEPIASYIVGYTFIFSPTNFTSLNDIVKYLCKYAKMFETTSGVKIANPYLGTTSLDEMQIRRDLI